MGIEPGGHTKSGAGVYEMAGLTAHVAWLKFCYL
jgi:hypothetical protein